MPPPGTFFDITAVPYSKLVTAAEFNVANEIWFRFITNSSVAFGHWTSRPAGIGLNATLYQSDGSTVILQLNSSDAWWRPLTGPGTYYIKIARVPVNPIAADFTYEADTKALDNITFPQGSVMIPGDTTNQLPAIIIQPDGTILTFATAIPTGEIGDSLPNGYLLIHDRFGKYGTVNALILINPNLTFNQVIVPAVPFVGAIGVRICHSATDFYAIDAVEGNVWKVTTTGSCTLVATIPEILADGVTPAGITSDASTIYFARTANNNSGEIQKYVIATGVTTVHHTIAGFVGPNDKIALTFDSNPGDLIVLPDGSYVTWWNDSPASDTKLIHVNAAGALINQYTFAFPQAIDHIHYASTTLSTHIKIFLFLTSTASLVRIGDLNLSTGVFDTSFDVDGFSSGQNLGTNDNTKFGPEESCPFITLFTAVTEPGLVVIVPNKKTDHDGTQNVAIPNPTFKTALLP